MLGATGAQLAHTEAAQLGVMAAFARSQGRERAAADPDADRRWAAQEEVSEWAADQIAAELCLPRPTARSGWNTRWI